MRSKKKAPLPIFPIPNGAGASWARHSLVGLAVTSCIFGNRIAAADEDSNGRASIPDSDVILQQITVTAQHRSENIQDVPISIQVLTADTLTQLNVATFDDFVKYLPNVSTASNGPGQGSVYMRGLSVGSGGVVSNGAVGPFPNVAIYLDEQSAQLPGRNLDVYAADLERIEVLEGPQGTLFGAGAQAGVLRYITNKPKLDVTEGSAEAGYDITAHGNDSSRANAMINLPLIENKLALRGVIYDDARGGYINNIPGRFVRSSTDIGIHYANYVNNVPSYTSPTASANNYNIASHDFNPVTYKGLRASGLYQINDDWDALLQQSYQTMEADGVFYETPVTSGPAVAPNPGGPTAQALPDLSVQQFNPSSDYDEFENTALTINGRLGDLKLVYAGSYLVRNVDQIQDYTNYSRGYVADYYQCIPGPSATAGQCYSPSATWHERERDTHNSQELRLSTPDAWRLRGLVGLFWENYRIQDATDYQYKSAPGFAPIVPPDGVTSYNPNVRNDNTAFLTDITRGYKQRAAFGSIDFDIIPKTLTLTVGTRYYRFDNNEVGSAGGSFGCYVGEATTTPCPIPYGTNLNAENLRSTYKGFKSRANLTWKVTDDAMLYYTWSQGFRPGGFNRNSTAVPALNYATPLRFAPDTLVNNELGWKTEWLGHHLLFNGAVYQEDWKNVQTNFFDPGTLGGLSFETNGPFYRVRGAEVQLVAYLPGGLSITSATSYNSSSQTNSPYLTDLSGKPITSIPNPYGPLGSSLANAPQLQMSLRARYTYVFNEYQFFAQFGGNHQGTSQSGSGYLENFVQPGYTTYDATMGVSKDDWLVQFHGENLTDKRYVTFITKGAGGTILQDYVGRPRTIGVTISYKFAGK